MTATFVRKRDCVRHERSLHSHSKPYTCKGCGTGFVRSDARGRHWKLDEKCAELHREIEGTANSLSQDSDRNVIRFRSKQRLLESD
jgi:hypothetical protein